MRNVSPSYLFALSNLFNVLVKYVILIKKEKRKKIWLIDRYSDVGEAVPLLCDGSWKLGTEANVRHLYLSKPAQIE